MHVCGQNGCVISKAIDTNCSTTACNAMSDCHSIAVRVCLTTSLLTTLRHPWHTDCTCKSRRSTLNTRHTTNTTHTTGTPNSHDKHTPSTTPHATVLYTTLQSTKLCATCAVAFLAAVDCSELPPAAAALEPPAGLGLRSRRHTGSNSDICTPAASANCMQCHCFVFQGHKLRAQRVIVACCCCAARTGLIPLLLKARH